MATSSHHTEPKGRHSLELAAQPSCPDPSVHNHSSKLQEQASAAALLATGKHSKEKASAASPLDANNKLSSRSAAMSLRYAQAQDLPSFPVVGIDTTDSANSAAHLANDGHANFEHWKPSRTSASAGKAAMIAKDYKMAPLWQPGAMSAAGSKAALLAHNRGGKVDLWMPTASADGNSAAGIAMRNKGLSPQLDYGYTEDGRKRALMAATGALSKSRSAVTPPPVLPVYPDSANSASNALNAASVANRGSVRYSKDSNRLGSAAMEAARVQNWNGVSRDMFGEHPPVEPVVAEKKHDEALRASAISMAKQMYAVQKTQEATTDSTGAAAALVSHNRAGSDMTDAKKQALAYINLQETAHRLASERLAKLDNPEQRYRQYYGYDNARASMPTRGRQRRRAGSESQQGADSDDEQQARGIRTQMSEFNQHLQIVDEGKRKIDRANLLAAAERKVQAKMHTMDEKVFAETGKLSPAMVEAWEARAREKAAKDSETRMLNHGKTHIGNGQYMDYSEIMAIAEARLKPTLDEISANAEKMRAQDETMRIAAEAKEQDLQAFKARQRMADMERAQIASEQKHSQMAAKSKTKKEKKAIKDAEAKRSQSARSRSRQRERELDLERARAANEEAQKQGLTKTKTREEEKTVKEAELKRSASQRSMSRLRQRDLDLERARAANEEYQSKALEKSKTKDEEDTGKKAELKRSASQRSMSRQRQRDLDLERARAANEEYQSKALEKSKTKGEEDTSKKAELKRSASQRSMSRQRQRDLDLESARVANEEHQKQALTRSKTKEEEKAIRKAEAKRTETSRAASRLRQRDLDLERARTANEEKQKQNAAKKERKAAAKKEKADAKAAKAKDKRAAKESKQRTEAARKEAARAAAASKAAALKAAASATGAGAGAGAIVAAEQPRDATAVAEPTTSHTAEDVAGESDSDNDEFEDAEEDDSEEDVFEDEETVLDEPNLTRLESPIAMRTPEKDKDGLRPLHPKLERHVSHIGDSDEDDAEDSDELEDIEDAHEPESWAETTTGEPAVASHNSGLAAVADRVMAQPVVAESAEPDEELYAAPVAITIAEPVASTIAEPVVLTTTAPVETTIAEPVETTIAEPVAITTAEPVEPTVAEPVAISTAEPVNDTIADPVEASSAEPTTAKSVVPEESISQKASGIGGSEKTPKKASFAPAAVSPTTPKSGKLQREKRESKGFKGLFSKLRSNSNKGTSPSEKKAPATTTTAPPKSAIAPTFTPVVPVVGDTSADVSPGASSAVEPVTGIEEAAAASPSSFRKHDTDLHSISSLSSGEPELGTAGVARGRGVLSKGVRKGGETDEEPEDEEFEEARDTFDEALAPPPSFGGAKSSSPVRETKFHEEV